tara:strand:- start:113 stop:226 length:114 start_codon:yes stop_codon:yes gene_type:complete
MGLHMKPLLLSGRTPQWPFIPSDHDEKAAKRAQGFGA